MDDGYPQSNLTDQIKSLKFSNETVVSLASLAAEYVGTDKDNYILARGWVGTPKLYGYGGNDTLYGDGTSNSGKSEILIGGTGDDLLYGLGGDDTYVYESGNDRVEEYLGGGTDKILFDPSITSADINIERVAKDGSYDVDMLITVKNIGTILLPNQYNGNNYLERLEFSNGTAINLVNIGPSRDINGTSGNDTLNGKDANPYYLQDRIIAGDGNDTLNGKKGNDILDGGAGNDTYIVGDGFDTIIDQSGTDKIVFDTTYDPNKFTYVVGENNRYLDIVYNGAQKARIINQFSGWSIESLVVTGKATIDLVSKVYDQIGNDTDNYITEIYNGGSQNNRIFGMGGNDRILAGYGDDFLEGGAGNDILNGYTGNDTYNYLGNGNEGFDTIQDSDGIDTIKIAGSYTSSTMTLQRDQMVNLIIRFGGKDFLRIEQHLSNNPIETIQFGNGTTFNLAQYKNINGTEASETLKGLDLALMKDDVIYGWGGNDTISGGAGNDFLSGDAGNDVLDGGAGNDTLEGGSDNDVYKYFSGGGNDTIYDTGGTADSISLGKGFTRSNITLKKVEYDLEIVYGSTTLITVTSQFGAYNAIEILRFSDGSTIDLLKYRHTINGTSGNDNIHGASGGAGGDYIYGLAGNDWIQTYEGDDYASGGDGDDTLYGFYGNDLLYGDSGNDVVSGDEGNDLINGGVGNDYLYGGNGNDTYEFFAGFGKDRIMYDYSGTDRISFKSTSITVDTISVTSPSASETRIISKSGIDEISLWDQQGTDASRKIESISFLDGFSANLLTYKSWIWGSTAAQTTNGTASADTILGRGGNDTISGAAGNDALHGGAGNDTVRGGDGNDIVHGGVGNDSLYGDAGNDTLYGDDGLDNLWGGAGADTFMFLKETAFKNIDVINDFSKSQLDKINIANLLQGYSPTTKAITDYVQITTSGSDSILKVDADGGANGFVQISTIKGVTGLTDEAALVASGNLVVV